MLCIQSALVNSTLLYFNTENNKHPTLNYFIFILNFIL